MARRGEGAPIFNTHYQQFKNIKPNFAILIIAINIRKKRTRKREDIMKGNEERRTYNKETVERDMGKLGKGRR